MVRFFVAFGQPDDGIACATAYQRVLARHRTDHGFAPTIRIGLHAGEATARDDDYSDRPSPAPHASLPPPEPARSW